jgi:hypothetical protein
MRTTVLLLFLFFCKISSAQVADTNAYNSKHKKHGYWLVYLDSNLNVCKNKSTAAYYGYDYYDNGRLAAPVQQFRKRIAKKVDFPIKPTPGKPVLLEGNFKFYDKNGALEYEEISVQGHPAIHYAYRWSKDGTLTMKEIVDFTQLYKGQQGSFYYEWYGETGLIDKYWYGKKENGKWDVFRE